MKILNKFFSLFNGCVANNTTHSGANLSGSYFQKPENFSSEVVSAEDKKNVKFAESALFRSKTVNKNLNLLKENETYFERPTIVRVPTPKVEEEYRGRAVSDNVPVPNRKEDNLTLVWDEDRNRFSLRKEKGLDQKDFDSFLVLNATNKKDKSLEIDDVNLAATPSVLYFDKEDDEQFALFNCEVGE